MNDISTKVGQPTSIQHPSINNHNDEDWQIIPSSNVYDDIVHANKSKSEENKKDLSWSKHHSFGRVCGAVLFTIISMTIGIIIICLTSPKETNTCSLRIKRTAERIITYDSRPQYLTAGKFNEDNYTDLVIANYGIDNIGIRLGNADGTFADQVTYSTELRSRPCWVATGDFNNDILLDVVVANYGTNNIGIFIGLGNGTFLRQVTFSLNSSRPLSLAVGDLNNDNNLDIVVVNNGTFNATILLGSGNGSFHIESNYYMGHDSMPCSVGIADFNNDSQLDIVTVNYGTSELAILLANESGTYLINKYSTGSGSYPRSVTTSDFNNDRYTDIAIANSATHNIGVFLGNGNGTFRTLSTYPTSSNSYLEFIVAGDVNDDKNLDLIVANSGEDNVIVFEGDGNGNFFLKTTQSTGYNSHPRSTVVNDIDNDNKSDIVVINSGTNYILVLTSYAFHITASQTIYSTGAGSYPNSVTVGDFNNDKQLDIIVTNTYSDNIDIFLGSGDGTFESQQTYTTQYGSGPYSIAVGDFNKDRQPDIAVVMYWSGTVDIYFGQGNGSFEYGPTYSVGGDYSYPSSIAIADFNNDTNLDLVTANSYRDNLGLFFGNGDGTFENAIFYPLELNSIPRYVCVDDFNSDNLLDLASANYGDATISIFLGNGNGTFQDSIQISTYYYLYSLVVGDLNNDKLKDIVFTGPSSSMIGVLLGYGNGTFRNIYVYFTGVGTSPLSIVLADFNKDNRIDIAVTYANNQSVVIVFGHGDGRFLSQETILIQYALYSNSIAIGDFNNDNQVDIVVGNADSDYISMLVLQYHAAFGNQRDYYQGSGSHPFSVTTGDFNNDNQTDIIVANSGNNTVQILFNYDNDTFMNNITYSTGMDSHPQYVVTADFNKDNQLDIAVVNSWSDTLIVFLFTTNGTILTATDYSTGSKSFPNSIALGDFNKDGWIDIVVANNNTDNIGVFLGYDYPNFKTRNMNAPTRGSSPCYVVAGDFNQDSQCDIAVAYRRMNSIGVFLGNGDGTFSAQSSYPVDQSSEPISLIISDFNKDNQLDIAVANSYSNSISILLGNSNGSFGEYTSYQTGSTSPVFIAVGDFNNDTKQDLVVANEEGNNIGVFMGYGNGSFGEQVVYLMPNESSPICVVVSDFNKDNILDIAVTNYQGNNIGILLGNGDGTFRNVTKYSTGTNTYPSSIATGDFDKDSCIDIAVANQGAQTVGIFFGYGDGTFSLRATYSTGMKSVLMSITVVDLNNDTLLDIASSDWGSGDGHIGVLYGLKNGTFLVPKIYSTGFNSQPTSVAICDFNNDGRADFAVSNSGTDDISIMLRNTSEPFGIQTTFSTDDGSSPYSVAVTDLNNDGQLDIAVANFKTNNIGIFLGYGDGSFAEQKTYPTGNNSGPTSVATGDFNDDDCADIVVTNSNTNNINIFLGDGKGTFVSVHTYPTGEGSTPTSVTLTDLNKDNQTDIVVTNSGIDTVLIFFGFGNGTFVTPRSISFDYASRPISTAVGDFNNDTWLDIAVATYESGYVEVLLQTC